jgi:predicted phosphodiesterase/orotate phosphoribosyltransferase
MNILHLTDLHISNPESGDEALRDAFYPEYLSGLIEKIKSKKIDKIFITGDIVDRSKLDNYPHAKKVIQYLADKVSVEPKDVFIVNGNHDIPRENGDLTKFEMFADEFNKSKTLVKSGNRYSLFSMNQDEALICIDSIGSNYSSGLPSEIDSKTIDEIIVEIRKLSIVNVFVLSHHPAASYSVQAQTPFDEGGNWPKEHIWPQGGHLFRRLANKATISGNAFWFSGDIHRQEHTIIGSSSVLVVTGSCNAFEDNTSAIIPQVRFISSNSFEKSEVYEYQFIGHNRKGLEGSWDFKEVSALNVNTQSSDDIKKIDQSVTEKPSIDNAPQVQLIPPSVTSSGAKLLKRLDERFEKAIYSEIIENKLYKFGRFDTCESITSLSWISITPLLDSRSIYKKVINQFKEKIEEIVELSSSKNECLLVGVDHWGSILAARLGAASNIRSCSIAVRGQSGSYDDCEVINSKLSNIIKEKKFIFVISDVISTGNATSSILEVLKGENNNWYGFTVICDPQQDRDGRLDKYNDIFYICGSLKMPIIQTALLPSKQVLSTDISFI